MAAPRQFEFMLTSEASRGIRGISAKDNMLSIFIGQNNTIDEGGLVVFHAVHSLKCLKLSEHTGESKDGMSRLDLLKLNGTLTQSDVDCFVKHVSAIDKTVLSDDDSRKILGIPSVFEQGVASLKQYAGLGASSFTYAFLTTLVEKYLVPYMISETHMNYKDVEELKSIFVFIIILATLNPENAALDFVLRQALEIMRHGLNKLGIQSDLLHTISSALSSAENITVAVQSPMTLFSKGVAGGAALAGSRAAYYLINNKLPKLKHEPAVKEEPKSERNEAIFVPEYDAGGLRKRNFGSSG
jgi:hypothetical protein